MQSVDKKLERITVFGAAGYIGTALVASLQGTGREIFPITRENISSAPHELGHAIYSIGLTSDFRTKTMEALEAHVTLLAKLISSKSFSSFTYLSSTRLYKSAQATDEDILIPSLSNDPDDIYTLSKLLGEAIVLRLIPGGGRICRLSNVYGGNDQSSNFLTSVLADARAGRSVNIMQAAESEKDYVHLDDVCRGIEAVALGGTEQIYNVAAGQNTSHEQIAQALRRTGVAVSFSSGQLVQFKPTNVERLKKLMDWRPRHLIHDLPALISN